jgi:cytochrome c oxidase assembly factor CtaG
VRHGRSGRGLRRLAGLAGDASVRRRGAVALAIVLLLVALASPLAEIGEDDLLSVHIAQHVVLWDLAPIALLAGLGRLRLGRLAPLARPEVALPLWLGSLALWHLPVVLDACIRNGWLHTLQHAGLFAAGLLMWAPVLGAVRVPAWFGTGARVAYVAVMQLAGLVFGNVLLWSGVLYPAYADAGRWGLTPQADQRVAGGIVLIEGSLVAIGVFAWIFLGLMREEKTA